MIALAGTIISSTLIFVIFRLFEKYKVDTFQAIVFNYFTAFICGFLLYSNEFSSKIWIQLDWIPYTFLVSLLFISLFFLMGQSSQKNGVAITSVAVKMSLAVSMVGMILIYNEALTLLKITGILLALAGVLLVSISKNTSSNSNSSWKMLLVLFIGSGILDLTLNYTQQHVLNELTPALFSSFGFGIAGIIGSFVIIYQMVFKSVQIKLKNIIAGIILGIPNYFSIFLLLKTYEFIDLTNSSILAIVNVSVVVFSAIFGFVIFRELFTTQKAIGLIASILAILSLYFAFLLLNLNMKTVLIFCLLVLPALLNAQQNLSLAVLKYNGGGDYYANPTALPNLIKYCNKSLGTKINEEPPYVEVGSKDLFLYPFIHMTGHGNVVFSKFEAENLRMYLEAGGFLHIDDNYGMDQFIRVELKKIFPNQELIELPSSHPIFNQKFKLPGLPKIHEHDGKRAQAFGLFSNGRLVCLYTYETDLSDGWEDQSVHNDPNDKRQEALQMGANIISYAFNN